MRGAVIAAALIALTALMATITASTIATHRAQVMADLAAVAAAQQRDCAVATTVVHANGGSACQCVLDGEDAIVTVGEVSSRAGP